MQHQPGRPKTPAKNSAKGSVISRNWVKTRTFCWRAANSSQISRQPVELAALLRLVGGRRRQLARDDCKSASTASGRPAPGRGVSSPRPASALRPVLGPLGVEGRLPLAEPQKARTSVFSRQIGDHAFVGLQPPQEIGLDQRPQAARSGSAGRPPVVLANSLELPWRCPTGPDRENQTATKDRPAGSRPACPSARCARRPSTA